MKKSWKIFLAAVFATAAVFVLLPILFFTSPAMPPGTNVAAPPTGITPENIHLLIDDTAWDAQSGKRVINQEIFDEILAMIDRADRFIYVDLFLWNPWQGSVPENHRQLGS